MPSPSQPIDLSFPAIPDAEHDLFPTPPHTTWDDRPQAPSLAKGKMGDEAKIGPLGAKAIAAVTGAVSTSLLMTPFDVLKTRMQTVRPNLPPPPPPTDLCCQIAIPTTPSASSSATCLSSTLPPNTSLPLPQSPPPPPANAIASSSKSSSAFRSLPLFSKSQSPAPDGCLHPSKWAGIWGEPVTLSRETLSRLAFTGSGSSGGVGTLTLDEAAGRMLVGDVMSLGGGKGKGVALGLEGQRGFWGEIGAVMGETGVRGLWKGVGTTLTMSIPSAAIYMLGYEHLLSILSPHLTPASPSSPTTLYTSPSSTLSTIPSSASQPYLNPTPLLAGGLARTISATVISPVELFRTRLQALGAPGQAAPTYASTTRSIVGMVREKGIWTLWRGIGATLWRDVPFSAFYWAGFEATKKYLTESQLSPPGLTTTFLSGAFSGTVASLLTSPFDVLKTRRQVFNPSPECSPEALRHRASTWPLLRHVVKTEGWRALFAGVVPRTAKVAPACGLMIGCYEGVGRWLGGKEGSRL